MADPKQIDITLTLKDEATKKIQSFRSSVKEFSNYAKDAVEPVLQLRQAWMKASLAAGITIGVFIKAAQEIAKLREEISKLDITSIKLGISSEELSKKLYGFNIGTFNARIGADQTAMFLNYYEREILRIKTAIAEGIGGAILTARTQLIYEKMAREYQEEHKFIFPILGGSIQNPLAPFGEEAKKMREQAGAQAKKQLEEESAIFKELEAIKKGITAEVQNKIQQLTQSTFDFKEQLFNQELDSYKVLGVNEIQLEEYKAAHIKRTQEDLNLEYIKQLSGRYKAQGDTLEAMKQDQIVALNEYVRQWGPSGGAIGEFIAGQEAQLEAAKKAWFGIKNQFQITQQVFNGYVSAMENTFSTFIEDGLHGSLQKGTDYFRMFGDEAIKIISKIIAQMAILATYNTMTGKKFGWGDILGLIGQAAGIAGGIAGLGGTANIAGMGTVKVAPANYYLSAAARMQEGGEGIVRKPTLFMAGEAGPERYQFTPIDRLNRQGTPGGITIHFHINIYAQDAKSFIQQLQSRPEIYEQALLKAMGTNSIFRTLGRKLLK
jgi:hypothetical protein